MTERPSNSLQIKAVPIDEVDRRDLRFQLRLEIDCNGLLDNLRESGQRTPILLWGTRKPYVIIDGFRRLEALISLGHESMRAIVRSDLSESEAFGLAFSENCHRATLQPRDKAYAVWLAINRWGIPKLDVAAAFALSVRHIDRYLQLFDLPAPVMKAVSDRRISFAHALVLDQYDTHDKKGWIEKIEREQLSAAELRVKLKPRAGRRDPRSYLVRDSAGFRLKPIRYRRSMPEAQKRRIWYALQSALRIVAQSSTAAGTWPAPGSDGNGKSS